MKEEQKGRKETAELTEKFARVCVEVSEEVMNEMLRSIEPIIEGVKLAYPTFHKVAVIQALAHIFVVKMLENTGIKGEEEAKDTVRQYVDIVLQNTHIVAEGEASGTVAEGDGVEES